MPPAIIIEPRFWPDIIPSIMGDIMDPIIPPGIMAPIISWPIVRPCIMQSPGVSVSWVIIPEECIPGFISCRAGVSVVVPPPCIIPPPIICADATPGITIRPTNAASKYRFIAFLLVLPPYSRLSPLQNVLPLLLELRLVDLSFRIAALQDCLRTLRCSE